ncbi:hypothetical protein SAMN04489867_3179 [Pedococcus dokdonensis]|uniref:Uncharacterized protein n=1 Tax=Pedococcus dokdonensis TaxID=443156 RepID=A0A1H0U7W2_9MICO|nr:hypothetical protein SAMN04489867_3179 [Pedococcus dokdonensis]
MKRPRVTLRLLQAILVVHAIAVVTQPLMAGLYLSGDVDAMNNVHSPIGSSLWLISVIQLAIALLYWGFGGGQIYPAGATVVLFVAEFLQMFLGQARLMKMHLPLGVTIVTSVFVFTVWSFTTAAREPRPAKQAEPVG